MADCVSLPNAAWLVERMRLCTDNENAHCKGCEFLHIDNNLCMNIMVNCAADAIEALLAENTKLKAELKAAVADIIIACRGERTLCGMCGNKNCEYAGDNQTYCYKCTKYKWRGVPKEEEDGKIH